MVLQCTSVFRKEKFVLKKVRPKILFISRGLGIGGAQKILAFVANRCVDAGYDVTIISLTDNEPTLKIRDEIKIDYAGYNPDIVNPLRKIFYKLSFLKKLRKMIRDSKPDLIVTFMADVLRIAVLSSTGLKIPIIGSERANPLRYTKKQYLKYSKAYRKCNAVVFQTQRAASVFDKNIRNKSLVIPNPCIPRLKPIEPYTGIRRKVITAAGRLENQKRFDILISAFSKVVKKHPDYQLHIYGEGDQRGTLQDRIEQLSLNKNVVLKGAVKDVFTEVSNCTAFVLSSDYEGIPNVLIEALSIGIPCISTDCEPGGPRLLFDDGRRGILVPTGDIDSMANAICNYIENPKLANQFGELGKEVNKEFAPDTIAQQWLDTVELVLGSKSNN